MYWKFHTQEHFHPEGAKRIIKAKKTRSNTCKLWRHSCKVICLPSWIIREQQVLDNSNTSPCVPSTTTEMNARVYKTTSIFITRDVFGNKLLQTTEKNYTFLVAYPLIDTNQWPFATPPFSTERTTKLNISTSGEITLLYVNMLCAVPPPAKEQQFSFET